MPPTNLLYTLTYLQQTLQQRLKHHLNQEKEGQPFTIPPLTLPQDDQTPFTKFIRENQLKTEELVVLLLGLVPHIYPNFIDSTIAEIMPKGGNLPEIGGVKGKNHRGTMPTGETALFILAGNDLQKRFQIQQIFSSEHFFEKHRILTLEQLKPEEPRMSGRLILDPDYVELFTTGQSALPRLSMTFPAKHLTTKMEWVDLVLNPQTLAQIRELEAWIKHSDTLLYDWGMERKIKPGYRVMFHGPPGTGKTLTATLLGKYTGKEVFRIDLSMIVSKFIGETEKNLATLFDKAQNKDWILFFDEADAIFGKRTNVRDAHDKYANQEVSYLLQRIEDFPGLTILASNLKDNIDEAFIRRFNSIIYFPLPKPTERLQLWRDALPEQLPLAKDVDLNRLAQKYELSGSHIINIVQFAALKALEKGQHTLSMEDFQKAIRREYAKEGKLL